MQIGATQGLSVGASQSTEDTITISGPDAEEIKAALSNMLSKNPLQTDSASYGFSAPPSTSSADGLSDEDILKMLLERLLSENSGNSVPGGGAPATGASSDLSGLSDDDLIKMLLQRLLNESTASSGTDGVSPAATSGASSGAATSGAASPAATSEAATVDGLMNPNASYIDGADGSGPAAGSGASSLLSDGLMNPNAT